MPHAGHYRKLERAYLAAPCNAGLDLALTIEDGRCRIELPVRPGLCHAAGAVHGSWYFKLLDDAAFFAANSQVEDRFLLTASYQVDLFRPVRNGSMVAEGRLIHRSRRLFVAEATVADGRGRLVGRGSGTFVVSEIPLDESVGYR